MLGDSVCRLLYQPPVALFTDINGLMTKYSSLCPKLSKYLDTQLPSVDVCDRESNRQDKSRTVVSRAFAFTHPHTDTLLQSTVKYQGSICLHVQNSQGKMQCFMVLSFICTYRERGGPDGRKTGFCRASAGSNQTFFCAAASFSAVQLSNRDLSIKLRDESRALMAMRAFITNLSLSSPLASRLGSYCGIMDIPFLCLFSLEIFTHTKETK